MWLVCYMARGDGRNEMRRALRVFEGDGAAADAVVSPFTSRRLLAPCALADDDLRGCA